MRSSMMIATLSLAASAFAFGTDSFFAAKPMSMNSKRDSTCMSADEAQKVANNFNGLISNYSNDAAARVLTTNFNDYSDSVTELINSGCTGPVPLGSITFDSLASFQAGQGGQPNIPFEQLNIWYNCNTVFLRWRTALTPQFVTGIIVAETTAAPAGSEEPWLINTIYSEFNSAEWLVDLGVFVPTCAAASKRSLRL